MACLFCNNNSDFNTIEHIIPESLGNTDLVLEGEVCDRCQKLLGKIEKYVLSHTPIGFWRVLLTIKTKKGNFPFVDFSKPDSKGAFPDSHSDHDDITVKAHEDFTSELITNKSISEYMNQQGKGKLKYVITPKVIHEVGRFLGKIGLELICKQNRETARQSQFNEMRRYVKEGSLKELWPIFHSSNGKIQDLFTYTVDKSEIREQVMCYSYSLKKIDTYQVLEFNVGTDFWYICLNSMYPTPLILAGFPDKELNLIWYSKEQWKE
jgi:hypothetical protein